MPAGANIRLACGPKGSYRLEHVLHFLGWALAPWTAARRDAGDYRLLYLDAYSAHLCEEVKELAWTRGYVVAYHFGCTTGICQVNDTDLHGAFSREYQYSESLSFIHQQVMDPGNISRSRHEVLADVASVWSNLDHQMGVQGHLRVGLSNSLDGSDDHRLTREALAMWTELGMSEVREREVADVRARVRAGELSWSQESIAALFAWPEDGDAGAQWEEGMEAEGALDEDEAMWDDDDGASSGSDLDPKVASASSGLASASSAVAVWPVEQDGDTPAEVDAAEAFAARMKELEVLARGAADAKALPVQWYLEREMQKLRKAHHLGSQERQPSAIMQRFLAARRVAEDRKMAELREEARKKRAASQKVKAAAKAMRARTAKVKAKTKANKAALAKYPTRFTDQGLGQGHKTGGARAHLAARVAVLERLRARAPPLPPDLDALWPVFVHKYAKKVGDVHKAAVGHALLERVKEVQDDLGHHLLDEKGGSRLPSGKSPTGCEDAFAKFVRRKWKSLPKAANELIL